MSRTLRGVFTASVIAASLFASTSALFANDMFLKVDGITGESTDDKHRGEIDILSWSWGESTGTARTSRGLQPTACIQDMSLTKFIDSSSPALIMNAMSGEVVPTAVLVVRKAGESQLEFLRITMKNVSVTSFQTGGSGGEDRITENVVLHFDSMQGQYRKQRADGTADVPITWDISAANSAGCR